MNKDLLSFFDKAEGAGSYAPHVKVVSAQIAKVFVEWHAQQSVQRTALAAGGLGLLAGVIIGWFMFGG